jgi:hypothetical protein
MPRISRSGASGGVLDLSILQRCLKSTSGRNLSRGAPSCKASSGGSGGDREASLHPRFELVVPVCDDETLFALPYCERSCSVSEELSVPSPPAGGISSDVSAGGWSSQRTNRYCRSMGSDSRAVRSSIRPLRTKALTTRLVRARLSPQDSASCPSDLHGERWCELCSVRLLLIVLGVVFVNKTNTNRSIVTVIHLCHSATNCLNGRPLELIAPGQDLCYGIACLCHRLALVWVPPAGGPPHE